MSPSTKMPALLSKTPSLIRYANRLDYLAAVVCVGLGVWQESTWWFIAAGVSLLCAVINPTQRLHHAMLNRITKRGANAKS